MTSKLKALGLALVAVFAMSAIAASAAQATPTVTIEGGGSGTLSGTGGGLEGQEKLTSFGSSVECEKSEFSGEGENASSTITVKASYGPLCFAQTPLGKLRATVTMNGCDYLFHLTEKVAAGHYRAHVDIVCPENKVIEIHVYASEAAHKESNAICTFTIPAQTNRTTVTIKTKTTEGKEFGDAEISGKVEKLKVIQHRNSFLCPSGTEEENGSEEVNTAVTIVGSKDFDISGE